MKNVLIMEDKKKQGGFYEGRAAYVVFCKPFLDKGGCGQNPGPDIA